MRDPEVWRSVLQTVTEAFLESGIAPLKVCASPITGHKGNHEFLLLGQKGAEASVLDIDVVIQEAQQSN